MTPEKCDIIFFATAWSTRYIQSLEKTDENGLSSSQVRIRRNVKILLNPHSGCIRLFLSTMNMFESYILWSKILNWSAFKQKSYEIKGILNWNDTTKNTLAMVAFLGQMQI